MLSNLKLLKKDDLIILSFLFPALYGVLFFIFSLSEIKDFQLFISLNTIILFTLFIVGLSYFMKSKIGYEDFLKFGDVGGYLMTFIQTFKSYWYLIIPIYIGVLKTIQFILVDFSSIYTVSLGPLVMLIIILMSIYLKSIITNRKNRVKNLIK